MHRTTETQMFEIVRGTNGMPVIATRREVWDAWFLTNRVARAMCGMGPDTGAALPGVNPQVEAHVRRLRAARAVRRLVGPHGQP